MTTHMAYDEDLAERIAAALPDRDDVGDRKMSGGIADAESLPAK